MYKITDQYIFVLRFLVSTAVFYIFQLSRLQKENDSLVGKHSKYAQQLQNEDINLPDKMEVSTCFYNLNFIFNQVNSFK